MMTCQEWSQNVRQASSDSILSRLCAYARDIPKAMAGRYTGQILLPVICSSASYTEGMAHVMKTLPPAVCTVRNSRLFQKAVELLVKHGFSILLAFGTVKQVFVRRHRSDICHCIPEAYSAESQKQQ